MFYDKTAEATSRIAADMMLIACSSRVMELYPTYFSRKKQKVTSRPSTPQNDFEDREMVKIYPEVDVAVDVIDPRTKETLRVTGSADWAFGYSGLQGAAHGTFLVAMEAKRPVLFSTAESQLLTYLAILRELRIRAGKTNAVTQGFYTDGYLYRFMVIDADGEIGRSPIYEIQERRGLKTVFNFIVTILETALKSSPTVTPTKAGEQCDNEINNFGREIWSVVHSPYLADGEEEFDATPQVDLDD